MSRYEVIEESLLGHCCIEFTVIDTMKSEQNYSNHVCECLRLGDAQLICDALNKRVDDAKY